MNEVEIILGIVAIVVVAVADIVVRLRIAPRRRDKFLEDLLESMTGPEPAGRVSQANLTFKRDQLRQRQSPLLRRREFRGSLDSRAV